MASDDLQLLSVWSSPYVMRAEVALFLKAVPYSKSPQDLSNKSPLLLQSNPVHKKVPVLLHHGKAVCESMIIVQYVDEAFPSSDGKDLLPRDPYDRAIARFWADFVDKKILDGLMGFLRSGDKNKAAVVEIRQSLDTLEQVFGTVPKELPYFGGAKVGYVDVVLSPLIAWTDTFEKVCGFQFEFEKLPRLAGWMEAMRKSPCGEILPPPEKVAEFVASIVDQIRQASRA